VKARSLQDLGAMRDALAKSQREAAEARRLAEEQHARSERGKIGTLSRFF